MCKEFQTQFVVFLGSFPEIIGSDGLHLWIALNDIQSCLRRVCWFFTVAYSLISIQRSPATKSALTLAISVGHKIRACVHLQEGGRPHKYGWVSRLRKVECDIGLVCVDGSGIEIPKRIFRLRAHRQNRDRAIEDSPGSVMIGRVVF